MKRSINIIIACFCIVFTACETDIDKMHIHPTIAVTPPLLSSEGSTNIIVDASNIDHIPVVLNWTVSDFGKNVLVEYSLEMATDASFTNSYVVTIGINAYSKALSGADLSEWVIDHFNGLDADDLPVKVDLLMRVYATVALENPTVTILPDKAYSNAIPISVVPYNAINY